MLCPMLRLVSKTGQSRVFPRVALMALMLLGAAANGAAQPQQQVLVLQTAHSGNMILDCFTSNFHVELDQRDPTTGELRSSRRGPQGSVGASERAVVDFIGSSFPDGSKPDLSWRSPALPRFSRASTEVSSFPTRHCSSRPSTSDIFSDAPLGEHETAVTVANDFPRVVDEMLQLLPQTRQVFVVAGSGQAGKFWQRELKAQFARFQDRLTFFWLDALSFPEILRRSASLPDNSAIFYITFGTDAAGAAYADERVLADFRRRPMLHSLARRACTSALASSADL